MGLFRFSEEFEELKHVGRDQPCTFAGRFKQVT
jgi:hypothetical protein